MLVLTAARLLAQPAVSSDEQAIWSLERHWIDAERQGDSAAFEHLLAKDYSSLQPDGHIDRRADDIREYCGGPLKLTRLDEHEVSLRRYGDSAVVTGRAALEGTDHGRSFAGIYAFSDFLVKRNGAWIAVAEDVAQVASTARYDIVPLWRDGGDWLERHRRFVEQARQEPGTDLLFVGDSITDFWRNRGAAQWSKFWGGYQAANLGISGDRTEHVLWRLQNGEVDGLHPKVIVLMIGTNNIGLEHDGFSSRGTPEDAAGGVKAVVAELRRRCPAAKILLLGVFPRAHASDNPMRADVAAINRTISALDDQQHVFYRDIGPKFLEADGTISSEIMPDFLHPSPRGYEIWGGAIADEVRSLMQR
ncbi:MAG TPA: GDSL-type esterase/lipase family protein [Opitutaceae bacterium]|jgi:N-acetylglucosamine-6-sulfatase